MVRGERLRWPPRRNRQHIGTRQRLASDENHPAPQPNERDESPDSQTGDGPRGTMKQAADDVARGLEDTDCRNSAGKIVRQSERKSR
jgi:hypothetical protein